MSNDVVKRRVRFAWFPVKRWSSRYYQNSCYWLRWVKETWIDCEWKAIESDNA